MSPLDALSPARRRALQRALHEWFARHARPLPWRRTRDPYRIWLAEVMLQQTRVPVVLPAYRKFLRAYPTVRHLARASEEGVLAHWSGLGYYERARSLRRAAQAVVAGGVVFPRTLAEARALPGVGEYTAAAVLSIAYGVPVPAVDGNARRVLSRLFCLEPARSKGEPCRTLAAALLDRARPGMWNQALMELGETVCVPGKPRCALCPIRRYCAVGRSGWTGRDPARQLRRVRERVLVRAFLLRDPEGRLLVERGAFSFLPQMWLPVVRAEAGRPRPCRLQRLGCFRHAIGRRLFDVEVCAGSARDLDASLSSGAGAGVERRFVRGSQIRALPHSALLRKAVALLRRLGSSARVPGAAPSAAWRRAKAGRLRRARPGSCVPLVDRRKKLGSGNDKSAENSFRRMGTSRLGQRRGTQRAGGMRWK